MLTLVSTLVTVIVAFGTTEPLASLTSPVIVAFSCCADTTSEQSVNNPKIRVIIDSLVFIDEFSNQLRGDLVSRIQCFTARLGFGLRFSAMIGTASISISQLVIEPRS